MLITSLISLIITLAILAVVYILVRWLLGVMALPAPTGQILNVVVGVIAVVLILQYLLTLNFAH